MDRYVQVGREPAQSIIDQRGNNKVVFLNKEDRKKKERLVDQSNNSGHCAREGGRGGRGAEGPEQRGAVLNPEEVCIKEVRSVGIGIIHGSILSPQQGLQVGLGDVRNIGRELSRIP